MNYESFIRSALSVNGNILTSTETLMCMIQEFIVVYSRKKERCLLELLCITEYLSTMYCTVYNKEISTKHPEIR